MVEPFKVSVVADIILSETQRQRELAGLYQHRQLSEERYEKLLFERVHPNPPPFFLKNGLEYALLQEDGEIKNPSSWVAKVREALTDREGDVSVPEETAIVMTSESRKGVVI